MQEVEEANAGDRHGHVGALETACGGVTGIELGAGHLDAGEQSAGGTDAGRGGHLRNQGVAEAVAEDQMVVGVEFQLVFSEGGMHLEDGGLGWLATVAGWQRAGRWQRGQRCDGVCALDCRLIRPAYAFSV